jgi:ASC-1-like (ASCH) protein
MNKTCIHKYLTKCKTTELPPGFGDFLRGTVTLLIFSKIYNYRFLIDKSIHPVFSYFKDSKYYIQDENNNDDVIEFFQGYDSYEHVYKTIENLFKSDKSFSAITNCFYTLNTRGFLENYGKIPDDIQLILRDILQPNDIIEEKIDNIFKNIYRFDKNEKYKVIHLRMGDSDLLHKNCLENSVVEKTYYTIKKYIDNNVESKYILITDSIQMGMLLPKKIPNLLYWENNKIHIGGLYRVDSEIDNNLVDTIIDFITISRCSEIISNYNSGFSLINSCIYNIKYTSI